MITTPTTPQTSRTHFLRRKAGAIDCILVPSPGSGLIAAQVYVKRGSADEAPDEFGLASFTAGMLKRGTATRSSAQIAFELESLGAMTSHGSALDSCNSSIQSAAADFPAALAIFFDSLRNPSFDPRELEVERQAILAHLKRVEDEKFDFTYRQYIKRVFEGHGYGHMPEGEPSDVASMTPEKCRAWHAKTYRPENMMFAAAGDFEPDALLKLIERHVDNWPGSPSTKPRADQTSTKSGTSGEKEIQRELEQGFIVMGYHTPAITDPDHHPLRIAAAVLGEGFAGRLFTHLRDERSLAYAVGAALRTHRLGGHTMLYIGTQGERLDEAREGLLDEVEKLQTGGPTEAEMQRAVSYVSGKFVMDHQSLASRAGYLARWEDIGLGAEYDAQFVDDLRKVTGKQVHEAMQRWWRNPSAVILRPEKKT